MTVYKQMVRVLTENESIFNMIREHASGGPAPRIEGMTPEAYTVLFTMRGRAVSREFVTGLKPTYDYLPQARRSEAKYMVKRPMHALERDVVITSNAIAAYVARLQMMAQDSQN